MKVRDYLRQPDIKWVPHIPILEGETCLFAAVGRCYAHCGEEFFIAIEKRIRVHINGGIIRWNDRQTSVDAILKVVDELDI